MACVLINTEQQQDTGEKSHSEGADHKARAPFLCAEIVQPEAQPDKGAG